MLAWLIFFPAGLLLGTFWFAVIPLPLFYGFPRASLWALRGWVRFRAPLVYLGTVLLWTVVFTVIAFLLLVFWPSAATYLLNSEPLGIGQLFGVGVGLFRSFSSSGRADLRFSFARLMHMQLKTDDLAVKMRLLAMAESAEATGSRDCILSAP